VIWSCVNKEHWPDFIFFSFFGSLVGFDSERLSILAGLKSLSRTAGLHGTVVVGQIWSFPNSPSLVFPVPVLQFNPAQAITTGPVLLGLQAVSKLHCTIGSLVQIDSLFLFWRASLVPAPLRELIFYSPGLSLFSNSIFSPAPASGLRCFGLR
jgi:hypothetical protein